MKTMKQHVRAHIRKANGPSLRSITVMMIITVAFWALTYMTFVQENEKQRLLQIILILAASATSTALTLASIMTRMDMVKKARLEYSRISGLEVQ